MLLRVRRFSSTAWGSKSSVTQVIKNVKILVCEGMNEKALKLYKDQLHGNTTSSSILPSVITACSRGHTHHIFGLQLHCYILKAGIDAESVVSNSFISMYAKSSETESALEVFGEMSEKDTISWNSIITCFVQNGYGMQSLYMFKEMYALGFVPKPELLASVVSVCVWNGCMRLGREIHALVIVDDRIEETVFLSTALLNFYWKCQNPVMAFRIFNQMEVRNEVSWTAMISGCAADQYYGTALDCFIAMQAEGIKPNRITLIAILPACDMAGCCKHVKEIHGYAFRHGYDSDIHFSSALIHNYCKRSEAVNTAKQIFELSTNKDVVLWTSIIASCAQSKDDAEDSITYFTQMQRNGIAPNSVTMLAVISACTNLSSISHGRGVHGYVLKYGLDSELSIGNCFINMYSKCGSLKDSQQIFKELSTRDSISWGALINAYALHGYGAEALNMLYVMQKRGLETDPITYLAVLSACNHAGLVEEGQKVFDKAENIDNISLRVEHYACYIDLLGRAGKVEDACGVIRRMPMKPSTRIWSSLISACKLHGRLQVAEMLAHQLIESEPENAAFRMALSMVYAETGRWSGVEDVRIDMNRRGLQKSYGFARLES